MRKFDDRLVVGWYEFNSKDRILYIDDDMIINDRLPEDKNQYKYIVVSDGFERLSDPSPFFSKISHLMSETGILLFFMNNRFGIRYFCGDRDIYTGRNFDGVENYRRVYTQKNDSFLGRMYSRSEMRKILFETGLDNCHFFSIINDTENPRMLFREDYLPNEDLAGRVFPEYNYPQTVFLEEECLYNSLSQNGMFHEMANAYLVECTKSEKTLLSDVVNVTASLERNKEDALYTIVHKDCKTGGMSVEKRPVYSEGEKRINDLVINTNYLVQHGIPVVGLTKHRESVFMDYQTSMIGQLFFRNALNEDLDFFYKELDVFVKEILDSSEHVDVSKAEKWGLDIPAERMGVILKKGFVDMVPLNSFYHEGRFVFFDQEYVEDDYPANAIITRVISSFYGWNIEFNKILNPDELYRRYGLLQDKDKWLSMERRFLERVWGKTNIPEWRLKRRRNPEIINTNRQRMNYSAEDYYRLFVDIFNNADSRKLILFGSGKFAERFYDLYHYDYPPYAVVDNNTAKWGEDFRGMSIQSPEMIKGLSSGEYKVIVCIKNHVGIMAQLNDMGVKDYSIYDPAKDYPRKRKPVSTFLMDESDAHKKYHTGYVSGVFDLFHIGHLNLLRRAKEQCDYLIVGVVSDEGVRKHKKTEPFVPFNERIEIVKACRYVDEAVEIPLDLNGPKEAWPMFHYDVQFSGSDYIDSPYWLDAREYLREHGADLVFFPYTQSTSSTSIKALISKKLV